MNYITNLKERKEALMRIIPKVPVTNGRWGKKLDWVKYFQANPFDAPLLGYDQRETKPELWNRNNVLGRNLINTGKINANGIPGVKIQATRHGDIEERKALLRRIMPLVPRSEAGGRMNGSLNWKTYFAEHPEHAKALGYGDKARPRIWAANLRMTQEPELRRLVEEPGALVPYKVETIDTNEAAERVASELTTLKTQLRELRDQLREMETLNANCRAELDGAKDIIFELSMQLRDRKKS